jgi:hypothetical protein
VRHVEIIEREVEGFVTLWLEG